MRRSSTPTLIKAMRILARDIQSGDGVAEAAIAEAADRMQSMSEHIGLGRILISSGQAMPDTGEHEWDDLAQEWLNDANTLTEAHDATASEGGEG